MYNTLEFRHHYYCLVKVILEHVNIRIERLALYDYSVIEIYNLNKNIKFIYLFPKLLFEGVKICEIKILTF